jgi:hypothetical protein
VTIVTAAFLVDRIGEIDEFAVDDAGERGAGEAGEIAAATSWTGVLAARCDSIRPEA